jgi:polar amino acid transport system permease protein
MIDLSAYDFGVVYKNIGVLAIGYKFTILVFVVTAVTAFFTGTLIAILRTAKPLFIKLPTAAYISVFRCTPALVQLAWIYFVIPPMTGLPLTALTGALLACGLRATAFYGEAIRLGLQAIPKEQQDAAKSLGLSWFQRQRYVIVPQAARIAFPVIVTSMIGTLQQTSLVSTIAVPDLMYQGQLLTSLLFKPVEILTVVAMMYLLIAVPLARFGDYVEEKWRTRVGG